MPFLRLGKDVVRGVKDAGTPATLSKGETKSITTYPKGVKLLTFESAFVPATPTTPAIPAKVTKEWSFSDPIVVESTSTQTNASTGTVDTSVAQHRIDVESRRPLLYAAIISIIAGLGFMYVRFSTIAVICFGAAVAFFAAWKLSDISPWVGGLFLTAAIAGFAFYKRAEWDKDGDGVPDIFQPKPKP